MCFAGYYEERQQGNPETGRAAELDPAIVDELDRAPGNFIPGIKIHICGAQGPEWLHLRLLARSGGALNYHDLSPSIRYIVVRRPIPSYLHP